jgi:hypothetical protein
MTPMGVIFRSSFTLLSLNGGAIDRPKNVPDGLQNRYPARG